MINKDFEKISILNDIKKSSKNDQNICRIILNPYM